MSSHAETIKKITEQLNEWDYKIDRLEHRMQDLKDEAKEHADHLMHDLKSKKGDISKQMEEIGDLSTDVAIDLLEGVKLSWAGIRLGVSTAISDIDYYLENDGEDDEDDD